MSVRRLYLLAFPAGHSVSPQMQEAAFAYHGLAATYSAIAVPPEELAATLSRLSQDPAFLGANVSVPHKQSAMELVDVLSDRARAVGAVNTLWRDGDLLVGDNTDGLGFLRSLGEAGHDPAGRSAVLLGAGGSARAVASALAEAGADVRVANRTGERARALVADLQAAAGTFAGSLTAVADLGAALAEATLLVNCTSVGMAGGPGPDALPLDVDLTALPADALVVDLVYRPAETPLLASARALGLGVLGGLGMLVHQGAAAFEAWTGLSAPVAQMRRAASSAVG